MPISNLSTLLFGEIKPKLLSPYNLIETKPSPL